MIRVGVLGAAGRMGEEVCRAVSAAPDMALVAAVDPRFAPDDLRSPERTRLVERGAEVVVDFTSAAAAVDNLVWAARQGIHAVVGTTGLTDADMGHLASVFDGSRANAIVAPNFSIGAVLLMRLCELAAPHMDGVEILELHHDAKIDAPSGTALETARRIAQARDRPLVPDATREERLSGSRGGVAAGGIHVHAVRLPGLVAHQEVVFGAAGQTLTVRHDSYDRAAFMPGVLLAVRTVGDRPGLTVGIESLLGV